MKENVKIQLNIDTDIMYLHSLSNVYKTERFLGATRFINGIDRFLDMVAGGIKQNIDKALYTLDTMYMVDITGCDITLFFTFGKCIEDDRLNKTDIIFYKFLSKVKLDKSNEQRVLNYLKNDTIKIDILEIKDTIESESFKKLYILTDSNAVNFPLLNQSQKEIVEIEDKNVLVQGVAGSGKTNICIDKIIYSACREYTGKVLYTTYSRGLLLDTKVKVENFKSNLSKFIEKYRDNKVVFLDDNHKDAIQNKLGVYFDVISDDSIVSKIDKILEYLDTKVDYLMLQDLYKRYFKDGANFVDDKYFINTYVKNIKNHQLVSKLDKVKHLSYEVIYKEIYGLIKGKDVDGGLSLEDYVDIRINSFSRLECETIYSLAIDYDKYMVDNNLIDNNVIVCRLKDIEMPIYSLSVIDEVQDFTEVNLKYLRKVSRKVFAVGDAMQMINPTYFSFAYLKRLLYDKDIVDVIELRHNYRNSSKISTLVENLNKININVFGNHSFVIKNESIDTIGNTTTIYVKDSEFVNAFAKEKYEDISIVVSDVKAKEYLKRVLPTIEILTVSEVKGLERQNVLLYNILSDNIDKWDTYSRTNISRKVADENSVYRYYYNLFYVGLTRAKQNIVVYESKVVELFREYLLGNFDYKDTKSTIATLNTIISKNGIDINELKSRIDEFIKLGQFENAYFVASRITDGVEKKQAIDKITIYKEYIFKGNHREAGIQFWQSGNLIEAEKQFMISKDTKLIELMRASVSNSSNTLGIDIVDYYVDVLENDTAKNLIQDVVNQDISRLQSMDSKIKEKFKSLRRTR